MALYGKPIVRPLPLSPDVQSILGRSNLLVWVNPPADLVRSMVALGNTMTSEAKVLDQELSTISRALVGTRIMQAGQKLFEAFELLWSRGPVDTHMRADEIARLPELLGADASQDLFDRTMSLIDEYRISLN